MPLATDCIYDGRSIDIAEAVQIKGNWLRGQERPVFRCKECGEAVGPHESRRGHTPHMEHRRRNPNCSLSHRARSSGKKGFKVEIFPLDHERAIEGYLVDRIILSYGRNSQIAAQCKERDGYRCRACDFHLEVDGRFVIDCHHLKPVAASGLREVCIDELVSLCPTCHRIAHTRAEPFTIEEIRKLRGQCPNLFIERTCTGKPGHASRLKR